MPIDFFHPRDEASRSSSERRLAHSGLSPVVPRTFRLPFTEPQVARQWQEGVLSGRLSETVSRLITTCSVMPLWTSGQIAFTLQHAAGLCLTLGQCTLANRCLQEAIAHLANGGPPTSIESDLQRWIFLAAVALTKTEVESARLWLRHASRTLTGNSSELNLRVRNHYLGDLLAIHACILSETEGPSSAAITLREATERHREAGSVLSVAVDLILHSRCLQQQAGSTERSRLKLVDSINLLNAVQGPDEAILGQHLLHVANAEINHVRFAATPQTAAAWN